MIVNLTISRTTSNNEDDYVSIEIKSNDGAQHGNIRVEMSMTDYAYLITGLARVQAKVTRLQDFKAKP